MTWLVSVRCALRNIAFIASTSPSFAGLLRRCLIPPNPADGLQPCLLGCVYWAAAFLPGGFYRLAMAPAPG
jgi:hypothetical protein